MIDYFIIAVLAFLIGYKASEIIHVISFKKILEDLNVNGNDLKRLKRQLEQEHGLEDPSEPAAAADDGKIILDIKIEEVQGQLFAYELHQDTFIAQGRDGEELLQRLLDRYPTNVRVICDRAHGGELINEAVQKLSQKNG
jgi:hypothetical protein